ncbi:MAG: hypothetical protein GY803_00120 [Chloroflexi bacterium]|nr:hypothetical protein [Chloroflexota bacterium]
MNENEKQLKKNLQQALILGVRDIRNKGDLAILKSEIELLQDDLAFDKTVVSIVYAGAARAIEPSLNIQPALVDAWIVSSKGGALLALLKKLVLALLWAFQILALPLQLLLAKVGLVLPYRAELYKAAAKSDAVFFTGGNQFMDVGSKTDTVSIMKLFPRWLFLFGIFWQFIWLRWLTKARIIAFPQSVGLFQTSLAKSLARRIILATDLCLLRESISEKIVYELGAQSRCANTYDVAFHLSKIDIILEGQRPILGIAPRITPLVQLGKYAAIHAQAADWWINEMGGSVVLLPSNEWGDGSNNDDVIVTKKIIDLMENENNVSYISMTSCEIYKGFLGSLDVLLSTRMHPTILAATSGVPYVAIYYEHKQQGLAAQLGVEDYLIDIANISAERTIAKIEQAFRRRDLLRKQLLMKTNIIRTERDNLIRQIKNALNGNQRN